MTTISEVEKGLLSLLAQGLKPSNLILITNPKNKICKSLKINPLFFPTTRVTLVDYDIPVWLDPGCEVDIVWLVDIKDAIKIEEEN